jgi:hypothetical protein
MGPTPGYLFDFARRAVAGKLADRYHCVKHLHGPAMNACEISGLARASDPSFPEVAWITVALRRDSSLTIDRVGAWRFDAGRTWEVPTKNSTARGKPARNGFGAGGLRV